MPDHPDYLRTPETVFKADPRSEAFSVLDWWRPKTLIDHYDAVAGIVLHDGVPQEIINQFETSKNLYFYSWFVYRFYPVVRQHAYACLELALRTRFREEILKQGARRRRRRELMLKELLKYAIDSGALANENFSAWQNTTRVRRCVRADIEAIERMKREGLSELEIDKSNLPSLQKEDEYDYLSVILKTVPFLRNIYAHGTSALDNKSLAALRLVAEIVNQVFVAGGQEEAQSHS